jgi:hypothetical protein
VYRDHMTLSRVCTGTCEDVSGDVNWVSCMAMAGDAGDTSEDAGFGPWFVCMEP